MLSTRRQNMRRPAKLFTTVAALVVVAAIGVAGASALSGGGASSRRTTVKTGHVLGMKVLTTPKGLTLYSLSAETNGRFICTDATCLSLWKPLVVARGVKPSGAPKLGTVRRPDGKLQVKYSGRPLYSFVQDKQPGDAKGEGFKDVGTWHVAAGKAVSKKAPSQPMSPGYGY
jgi:predicted lipoprotein with Yx(FWY)xxD motif